MESEIEYLIFDLYSYIKSIKCVDIPFTTIENPALNVGNVNLYSKYIYKTFKFVNALL